MFPILSTFHCQKLKLYAKKMAENVSMYIVKPLFPEFQFVGSDFHNNVYLTFCFEAMHSLFINFKNVKRICFGKTSPYIPIQMGNVSGWCSETNSFRAINNNLFFKKVLKVLDAAKNTFKFKQAFSKAATSGSCHGTFRETGLQDITEAKDPHILRMSHAFWLLLCTDSVSSQM